MMMGTADEIVKAPEKGTVFVEDLPEEEQAINLVWLCALWIYLDVYFFFGWVSLFYVVVWKYEV